jgi:hypothetical protein
MAVIDLRPIQLKNIERSIRVYSLEVGKPALARPAQPIRRSSLALGFAALVVLVAASVWYLLGATDRDRGRASLYRGAAVQKPLRRSEPGLLRR